MSSSWSTVTSGFPLFMVHRQHFFFLIEAPMAYWLGLQGGMREGQIPFMTFPKLLHTLREHTVPLPLDVLCMTTNRFHAVSDQWASVYS